MWEIVKIQELKQAGLSKTTVAEILSMDRGTVAKYWNCSDPEKQKPVYHRGSILDPYKDYIKERIEKWPQLSAERLFYEIKAKGYTGSDRTVRRYVSNIRPQNSREYKPYETLPGEQAQIDWGHMGEIVENGQRKKLYVFVFCLGWSRQRYVESNVKYVKRSFFYARDFIGVDDLNNQAMEWLETVANAKTHGTTGCIPAEQLLEEQKYLKPLPQIKEALPVTEKRKATKTSLISIDANKYSVPAQFARKAVRYLRYEDRIEILDDKNVIATHQLARGKNQTIINDDHYPLHIRPTTSPKNGLQAKFEALAPKAADYLQGLSKSRHGHLREQMEKIINLAKQHDSAIVSNAMERSLSFGAFGYGILKRIIDRQIKAPHSLPEPPNNIEKAELNTPYQVDVERRDMSYYGGVR